MTDQKVHVGEKAPDFTLTATNDEKIHLSDFEGKKNIYLVFNRGFF
jgi:peroxiredoxin